MSKYLRFCCPRVQCGFCHPHHVASLDTGPSSFLCHHCLYEQRRKGNLEVTPCCTACFPSEIKTWSLVISEKREMQFTFEKQLIVREKDCQAVNQTMVFPMLTHLQYSMLQHKPSLLWSSITQQIRLCLSLCRSGLIRDMKALWR